MRYVSGGLYLKDIETPIYMELEDRLSVNYAWRDLIHHMTLPSNQTRKLLEFIEQRRDAGERLPGKILLQRLDSKMIPIPTIIRWLEAANLMEPLLLLKPDEPLEIIVELPSVKSLCEGYPLVLSCQAKSFPPPEYQWFKGSKELLLQQEKELIIKNTRLEDSGSYYCRVRVFHLENPSELETQKCLVSVTQQFNEKEKRRGKKLAISKIEEEEYDSDTTELSSTTTSENFSESSSSISKKYDIEITKPLISYDNVRQGSIIVLECKAESDYPLKYQWYCDGCLLKGEKKCELRLENLYAKPHSKETKWAYSCKVSNRHHHRLTNTATVQLRASDQLTHFEPEEKIALLIANEYFGFIHPEEKNYSLISNDVVTMTKLLRSLGFKTISLKNLNFKEMNNAIRKFCETLGPNKYGFVYVAGHGIQLCKQTYLIPTDCAAQFKGLSSRSISQMTICTDCILSSMQSKDPALIVQMFDVCRNTPKGAEEIVPEKCCQAEVKGNTFRCYATSSFSATHERDEESNGYFVKHLEKHITKPRAQLEDIFKNVQVGFKNDVDVDYSQCPTMESSLNEFRTLSDTVNDRGVQSVFDKTLSWASAKINVFETQCFPVECSSDCGASADFLEVMLEFHPHRKTFCNSMDVLVFIDIPSDVDMTEVKELNIQLQFDGLRSPVRKRYDYSCDPDSTPLVSIIEVIDIQRVNVDITGTISVSNQRTGKVLLQEHFNLGRHPVSNMQLTAS